MDYSKNKITTLRDQGFKFKKKHGQNFITDSNLLKKIAQYAKINENDLVVEVGAGIGALTVFLAESGAKVITYEIDSQLKVVLEENLNTYSNVEIIMADFLGENLNLIKTKNFNKTLLVANLPYSVGSVILMKIINEGNIFDEMVIMLQKEVGERIIAKPKSKEYNAFSVIMQSNFYIEKIQTIKRDVFFPKPNVDSVLLSLKKKKELPNLLFFQQLVKDSFQQKRKTLKNNLKNYDQEKLSALLIKNGFTLNNRAEQIPVEIFQKIAQKMEEK